MRLMFACLMVMMLPLQVSGLDNANAVSAETAPTTRECQTFQTQIAVVNPYDRAVRVKILDASCSCAKLDLHSHFLLPHGRTTLDVTVDNANRSGPQDVHVSIYLTDPEFEPIEVSILWNVRGTVQVDSLPAGADTKKRPEDRGYQDIYRFAVEERPDEPQRLHKRIRLSCVPEEMPPGGLKITAVDYAGSLWAFTPKLQDDGSWLIIAHAHPGLDSLPIGVLHENVVIHTNHPDKPTITLHFDSNISTQAGRQVQAQGPDPGPSGP